jgi:pyrroline-5-carboxylate reductase
MKIAIVGGGNLGVAIAQGLHAADPSLVLSVSRRNPDRIAHLQSEGIQVMSGNPDCVLGADVVVLAVKPHQASEVLAELRPYLAGQPIVSVVSGVSLSQMSELLQGSAEVFRAMPNTAIAVRQSMTCLCGSQAAKPNHRKLVEELFAMLGQAVWIEEKLFDAATVLGACGIAYALRYIRASMQAGIQIGFDSETALRIAAQTVNGAAELLLQNNSHPEKEIDKVTTPQGCTIVGLNEMEHQGFSSSLIRGIQTSYEAIGKMKK